MIPLSDNMITPSGKLSLYLYSQSSQIILMSKNIQYDHSDESVVAKMSELLEEMRTEVLDQLDKIQETQEELEEKLSNIEESLN